MARMAGPVLRGGEMAQVILEAIEEENVGVSMIVGDHNGYIRIEGEEGLTLHRATIEAVLGRPFRMAELEIVMTGFSGKIELTADHVRWYFKNPAEETPA